jgi:hypothetical protein
VVFPLPSIPMNDITILLESKLYSHSGRSCLRYERPLDILMISDTREIGYSETV